MIWKIIAFLLTFNNNWLTEKLYARALKTPYIHLGDYMRRYWLFKTPWLCARFHVILRPDAGRHLHDHPFWFRSIILEGSYLEEMLGGELNAYHRGDVNFMGPYTFHKISSIRGRYVLTLVFHGPRLLKSWGFLVGGNRIHHSNYKGDV
jgi:hypothetical protein